VNIKQWRAHLSKWSKLFIFASATISAAAQSSGTDARSHAETYIKEGEAAWAESVARHDSSVVERILADDCVWVLDGEVLTKAEAIKGARESSDFLSNHLVYAHVRLFGNMAVVQGSESWTRKGGRTGSFIWTDTWLQRNGKWQIVAAQDTSVPAGGK
jgi:ketosteroid isomerase-like protein